jgi:hypothetical protein
MKVYSSGRQMACLGHREGDDSLENFNKKTGSQSDRRGTPTLSTSAEWCTMGWKTEPGHLRISTIDPSTGNQMADRNYIEGATLTAMRLSETQLVPSSPSKDPNITGNHGEIESGQRAAFPNGRHR